MQKVKPKKTISKAEVEPITKVSQLGIPSDMLALDGFHISPSQMITFLTCKVKWLLSRHGFASPAKESRVAFGTAFHWMLGEYYKFLSHGSMASAYGEDGDTFLRAAKKAMRDEFPSSDGEELIETVSMAHAVFNAYIVHYKSDLLNKEFVLVERELLFDARKIRIDAAYIAKKNLWIMETKTRGRIDEDGIMSQLTMDLQSLMYLSTLREMIRLNLLDEVDGKMPVGVLYNIVRTPGLKRKENENLPVFLQRIRDDISARPEWYFMRHEIRYTESDIERFEERELLGIETEMRRVVFGPTADPRGCLPIYRNSSQCIGAYGRCEYLSACAADDLTELIKVER